MTSASASASSTSRRRDRLRTLVAVMLSSALLALSGTAAADEGSPGGASPSSGTVQTPGSGGSGAVGVVGDSAGEAGAAQTAPGGSTILEEEATTEPPEQGTPVDVPSAPESSIVVGDLLQAWPEVDPLAVQGEPAEVAPGPLTWLEQADGSAVRLDTDDVSGIPAGATVELTLGNETQTDDAPEGAPPAREVLAASVLALPASDPGPAAAASGVTNEVTIARVVPAGGRADSMTATTLASAVNGPVAAYWTGQSGGRIRLGVASSGPGWITSGASCSDPTGLWNSAAGATGWVPGPGKHLLVYVSSLPQDLGGCSFGMAEVGGSVTSGGRLLVRGVSTSLLAHELGHNFGLAHSSALQCDGSLEAGRCDRAAYRDFYDVMGASWTSLGSLSAAQADRLGVLPSSQVATFAPGAPPTAVALAPVSSSGGLRALRFAARDGSTYWLEYRTPTGQDGWLGDGANTFQLQSGVLLRRSASGDDTSLLLDGTPSPEAGWATDLAAALPVGVSTTFAGGDFSVTVVATVDAGAVVTLGRPGPAVSARPVLVGGEQLASAQPLVSPNGVFRFVAQTDGNLVVYGPSDLVLWSSNRFASNARTILQADGNMVVYSVDGRAIWNSRSSGHPGARLVLQDDGNLVIYSPQDRPLWWPASLASSSLNAGDQLAGGGSVSSPDDRFRVVAQQDGNVVVYGPSDRVLWSSNVYVPGSRLVMQSDGNLVVYSPDGRAVWNSRTGGNPGARAVMQDDGNLVVYSSTGRPLWWPAKRV